MHGDYRIIADYVACELRMQTRGDIGLPQTWLDAGARMNCRILSHDSGAEPPGQYRTSAIGHAGVITYNRALPAALGCLVLVHELAHHVLMRESTDSLFGYVRCYDYGGAADARDEIARAVESIIFPGVRRSSKVRCFQARQFITPS
jgi:hypothetical protein